MYIVHIMKLQPLQLCIALRCSRVLLAAQPFSILGILAFVPNGNGFFSAPVTFVQDTAFFGATLVIQRGLGRIACVSKTMISGAVFSDCWSVRFVISIGDFVTPPQCLHIAAGICIVAPPPRPSLWTPKPMPLGNSIFFAKRWIVNNLGNCSETIEDLLSSEQWVWVTGTRNGAPNAALAPLVQGVQNGIQSPPPPPQRVD